MFDTIRSFFATKPQRARSHLGAGMSDQDEPAIPAFQKAWKDGATFDDLFGPDPFTLHGSVGRSGADNHRPDVAKVETFLGDAGYYKPVTSDGPSGWHSTNLDSAIRKFQKDKGLAVDGLLKPGGPTITAIGGLLGGGAIKPPPIVADSPEDGGITGDLKPEKPFDPWEQVEGGRTPGGVPAEKPAPAPEIFRAPEPKTDPVIAERPRIESPEERYQQEYDAWLKANWETIQQNEVLVRQGYPPIPIPAPSRKPGGSWRERDFEGQPLPYPAPHPMPDPEPEPEIIIGPDGRPPIRRPFPGPLGGPTTSGPTMPYPHPPRWPEPHYKIMRHTNTPTFDPRAEARKWLDHSAGERKQRQQAELDKALARPDPFGGHTISEDGAREHDAYAAQLVRDSNPDETARYLKNVIVWNGDQGRGDVADLLGRFAKVDEAKAKKLQDSLFRASGERLPFRVAPLGKGLGEEASTDSDSAPLPEGNPWGSGAGADRWEAGNMAKVLLGRSDYADATHHFAGEFARAPSMAKPYTAAVFEEMAKSSPKQAMLFARQMKAAGLVEETSAGDGRVLSAPIPPTATPGPLPPAKPGETDIRIPATPSSEPEKKPATTEGRPGGLGGAVGISVSQTGMPTVTKNGGVAGGGKSGKVTSPASVALRGLTGGARANVLRPLTGTASLGGSVARAIPFLGAFATYLDFLNYINSPEPPPPSA